MKIRDVDKICIVDIAGTKISESNLKKLKKILAQRVSLMRIGINLKGVISVNHDFLDFLRESSFKQRLSLFNACNDVYLLLFVSQTDKYVDIYLDENDFINNKRLIIYRRLKLLKSA